MTKNGEQQMVKPTRIPLSRDERDAVIEAALSEEFTTSMVTLTGMYSGLTGDEIAHLYPEVVSNTDDGVLIRVPESSVECRSGGCDAARGPGAWGGKKNDACTRCESERDGRFEFRRSRVIPIRESRAVGVIRDWFSVHQNLPSPQTVNRRVQKVGDRVGIERLDCEVLRATTGVILAEKGFTRDEIGTILGYSDGTIRGLNWKRWYGQFCEGENPFRCGEVCSDGAECSKPTLEPFGVCYIHDERGVCGAETADGSPCLQRVAGGEGRCSHHSD